MIIDCIGDLHGAFPQLAGGDLLIVAGDLTAKDTEDEIFEFFTRLHIDCAYDTKIVIAGNHDNALEKLNKEYKNLLSKASNLTNIQYLCDSGTTFYSRPIITKRGPQKLSLQPIEKYKIWGSPWTKKFPGMNPHCMAFTVDTDEELAQKWAMIPDDTDILITHCPAWGLMDHVKDLFTGTMTSVGSPSLREALDRIKPKLHVVGHIHEGYGQLLLKHAGPNTICVNASHMTDSYKPINEPIRVIL